MHFSQLDTGGSSTESSSKTASIASGSRDEPEGKNRARQSPWREKPRTGVHSMSYMSGYQFAPSPVIVDGPECYHTGCLQTSCAQRRRFDRYSIVRDLDDEGVFVLRDGARLDHAAPPSCAIAARSLGERWRRDSHSLARIALSSGRRGGREPRCTGLPHIIEAASMTVAIGARWCVAILAVAFVSLSAWHSSDSPFRLTELSPMINSV
jgi:hypothetical protein